jgi:decaprenylphospho-beta-D-erythro-pentofuranosid-2-ulose 2-reductase
VLLGRDQAKLDAVANDLRVRQPTANIDTQVCEFFDPVAIAQTVAVIAQQGQIDMVLIAHGHLSDQAECQQHLVQLNQALQINAVSPVLFAEAFATALQHQGHGKLAVIGSVAGDRGRQSNYVYGAAKGLIARYVEGMQHRFAGSKIQISLIKPGPTDTPMTARLKAQGAALASVENVAQHIVAGIEKNKPIIYTPVKWALIMLIIRHLPRFVFNRLKI